jgi:hypothetical protein
MMVAQNLLSRDATPYSSSWESKIRLYYQREERSNGQAPLSKLVLCTSHIHFHKGLSDWSGLPWLFNRLRFKQVKLFASSL